MGAGEEEEEGREEGRAVVRSPGSSLVCLGASAPLPCPGDGAETKSFCFWDPLKAQPGAFHHGAQREDGVSSGGKGPACTLGWILKQHQVGVALKKNHLFVSAILPLLHENVFLGSSLLWPCLR